MRPTLLLAILAASAFAVQGPKPPSPDEKKAQAAYDAVQAKLQKANSIKLSLEVHSLERVDKYELSFLRHNFAKIVSPESAIYQNGKMYYDYNPTEKEYWSRPAPSKGLPNGTAFSLGGLVGLETIGFNNEPKMTAKKVVAKKWKGEDAKAISLQAELDPNIKAVLYVGAKSNLPIGWEFELKDFKSSGRFLNIVLDAPMKPAAFAWNPPAGAKKIG